MPVENNSIHENTLEIKESQRLLSALSKCRTSRPFEASPYLIAIVFQKNGVFFQNGLMTSTTPFQKYYRGAKRTIQFGASAETKIRIVGA